MKTYGATTIFTSDGQLVTEDIHQLAIKIVEAEVKTIASDHESKLIRIEIGSAIRAIAATRGTSLTDAIIDMDLCKTTNRAEKTFLKYARIAGSQTLLDMAVNPQVSLSVLDEIAASKKPVIKEDRAKFMKRVSDEVKAICDENLKEEDLGDGEENRFVALGITRNQAVGVIRRVQMEMGVVTKAGGGGNPENPKQEEINSKLLQLCHLLRIMFLPHNLRDEWLASNGLDIKDIGTTMLALQNDLVEAGVLQKYAYELDPSAINGLKKMAQPIP